MRFQGDNFKLLKIFKNFRVLSGDKENLYIASGFDVFKVDINSLNFDKIGTFNPGLIRRCFVKNRLLHRLTRSGFRTLIKVKDCYFGIVAKHIIRKCPEEENFESVFRVKRGTRPLSLTSTPDGKILFGEYFNNPRREEVYIYISEDLGKTWEIGYVFPKNTIRHIHKVVYDKYEDGIWILTGDYENEPMIAFADVNLKEVTPIFQDKQQSRAVAMIIEKDFILYATDTELEENHIYYVDRRDYNRKKVARLPGSSMYSLATSGWFFFSTAVEPSKFYYNKATLWASMDGLLWEKIFELSKDRFNPKLFQYANLVLPEGYLDSKKNVFITPIATEEFDLDTLFLTIL